MKYNNNFLTQNFKVKGTKIYYHEDKELFDKIYFYSWKLAKLFNYNSVNFPIIYKKQLFDFKLSDLQEQLFQFQDKKKQNIVLVPEITKPVINFFNQHLNYDLHKNYKISYFQPCFRYEKPQFGRKRQFFQFGLEVLNLSKNINNTVIELIINALNLILYFLSPEKITIKLSFIPQDKILLIKNIKQILYDQKIKLCFKCLKREKKNCWLNILECNTCNLQILQKKYKEENFQQSKIFKTKINKKFPKISCIIDKNIIRGINYYNGTVLEIYYNSYCIAGGGFYNFNTQKHDIKNFGLALGVDRIIEIIKKYNIQNKKKNIILIFKNNIIKNKLLNLFLLKLNTLILFNKNLILKNIHNNELKINSILKKYNNINNKIYYIKCYKNNNITLKIFKKDKILLLKLDKFINLLI